MVFKCQSDSYLKEFTSKVVSCEKIQRKEDDKASNLNEQYEIILEDTILFPEGGGQPCDYGTLNKIPVTKIIRRSDKAVHITNEPVPVGAEVHQTLDWERRFDHMQQHTGQHLITAVLDRDFKYPTVSWWLGEDYCYIEIVVENLKDTEIEAAEETINSLIRDGKNVSVEVYTEDTPKKELEQVRARGLPEDHKGDIRVINIEDVDKNMCCGTHVGNLCQLQMVKLLDSHKGKRKDTRYLYFLVGNRVLRKLSECLQRECKLMQMLTTHPTNIVDHVDKLQKNAKKQNKNLQGVLKDVARLEASKLNNTVPVPAYFSLHRKEADPDFMNAFLREMGKRQDILLFLSTGDEKGEGNIVLYGPEKVVADLGPQICEVLQGKGSGKSGKYQGKVSCMSNRSKAEGLIKEYFKK